MDIQVDFNDKVIAQLLVDQANAQFHEQKTPSFMLFIQENENTSSQLHEVPSPCGTYWIRFKRIQPNLFVSNCSDSSVICAVALTKALGHDHFILSRIEYVSSSTLGAIGAIRQS